MEYTKIKEDAYNLHIINTDKFKTITVKINFKSKLKKEEITLRNMMVNILCESNKLYPTKRLLALKTEDLYDLNYGAYNYFSGKYNVMGFDISFLNESYTESGMLDKSIEFLSNIIFNPNITDDAFDNKSFKLTYDDVKDNIITLKENTDLYARVRMLECMDNNAFYSYRSCGYLEDLNKITSKNLYEYYNSVIKNDIVDIFVIGNVKTENIKEIIKKYFNKLNSRNIKLESHFVINKKIRLLPKQVKETQKINQSKLNLGFKIKNATMFELRYVLNIYSYILGGSADSKLFKTVREKNSLCYYISSVGRALDSILIIYAGINKENYNKTISLIKKEILAMNKGLFDLEEIEKAKITYLNSLKELEDNEQSILSLYSGIEYLGSDDIDNRIKQINKVTKSDIIKLSKKIHLDTIYLLEGESNEKK